MAEIQSKKWKATQAVGCLTIVAGLGCLLVFATDIPNRYGAHSLALLGVGVAIYFVGWFGSWWNHG
jgi:hypothetical protein